jgi:hypothetical protein
MLSVLKKGSPIEDPFMFFIEVKHQLTKLHCFTNFCEFGIIFSIL